MKLKDIEKQFVIGFGWLILLTAFSAAAARAQEVVDLPAFEVKNILTLERYTGEGRSGNFVAQIFRNLSDGDDIWVSRQPDAVARDRVRILLVPGARVTWWKGITFYKRITSGRDAGKWRRLEHVSVENTNGVSRAITLEINQLDGVALSFEKAKALGAHTPMYVMYLETRRADLAGQQVTFRWEKDR